MTTNENEKYELIKSNKTTPTGKPLFQVKAKINIGYSVKKGELGGYIEKEANLSIYGDAWVSGDALVYGNARVYGDARVSGDAWVSIRADITANIDFEIPRIKLDSKNKLDKLMKVLKELEAD